ncbi:carboxypeptidase-like regulatory domain-containing protein [Bremerella alba]|uniref:Carboxypeptidase regulatory-like domain-containing protein n=1 Tax=Bremerella alba TaxID=980252 RepID=A0A7V8V4Y1_9BACT|nr:carboxypeptidase-like regulatory domain-containing protein [Bremerella alba]MBA2114804.1 hypothetical protein [Bremerella alba]
MATIYRCALCAFMLISLGCYQDHGLPLEEVSGLVTQDGTPLEGVTLEFRPESGRTSFGRTDSAGKYQLQYTETIDGGMIGKHTVEIRVPQRQPSQIPGFAEMDKEERMMLMKYDRVTWPNAVAVTEGNDNVIDFELNEAN